MLLCFGLYCFWFLCVRIFVVWWVVGIGGNCVCVRNSYVWKLLFGGWERLDWENLVSGGYVVGIGSFGYEDCVVGLFLVVCFFFGCLLLFGFGLWYL